MRVLIQRVKNASVVVAGEITGSIQHGLLVLLGIEETDTDEDITWLCNKIVALRVFDDQQKVPNFSVVDVKGEIMVVSQFTLFASTKKGNRPGYARAARAEIAVPLYEKFLNQLQVAFQKKIETGKFGADMQVELVNDGPVTIWIDSRNKE